MNPVETYFEAEQRHKKYFSQSIGTVVIYYPKPKQFCRIIHERQSLLRHAYLDTDAVSLEDLRNAGIMIDNLEPKTLREKLEAYGVWLN